MLAKNYALAEDEIRQESENYSYTALFRFEGDDEPVYTYLNAKGMCPQIKFNCPVLNFAECDVNDHREVTFYIENKHKELPIDVCIPRMTCIATTPEVMVLLPS